MKFDLTLNGSQVAKLSALTGSKIFNDETITLSSISKELGGSTLFQMSWNDLSATIMTLSCKENCAIIVVLWEHENRQDDLMDTLQHEGWMLKKEQKISLMKKDKYGRQIQGTPKAVLSKAIQANLTVMMTKSKNSLPMSVFVTKGKQNMVNVFKNPKMAVR